MSPCPNCGRENPDDARFCNACGTPLTIAEPERESRKVVTVLFCDLVGSTSLGESTDPEALRARMRRYFEDLRVILERHGGTVEKFVGDAVMAVFGIPVSHEDDALRAVRAGGEIRDAVALHGLEARIGINTGEVVVGGQGETLVTGDAVNVAARLEQAAAAGTVLIGAGTRLLVRDAVVLDAVDPLTLKGKAEPVSAFRLVDVLAGADPVARRLEAKLVGRTRERERLWSDFGDAVADRTCRLFTLLGPAGIGKSRLVADFLDRIGSVASILRGRCLSYGEGITYWPLVEILIGAGVDPDAVIGSSPAETQLAFRRLLEARAGELPQVIVIDDLQWAESVFMDLVEHVADLSRDAPIFLLCVARTELLDERPGWGGGKLNATSLLLEPLGEADCAELIERLAEDASLDEDLRERITATSAGNPLYVEEMIAMVREQGGTGEVVVPPTIHALLQARIDTLDQDVRVVMERGAVEGEVFHRGAVAELAPDEIRNGVEGHLATLVRKDLIRSTAPTFPEDEGFRFRHLLIRDAAYESLPKATRAQLHEQFAVWLARHDLVERDEILGYHLEQAHRYREELDPQGAGLEDLARSASEHLVAAGQAALERADFNAASSLLERAANVLPPEDEQRRALAPELADAYQETGDRRFVEVLDSALNAHDPITRARAAAARATYAVAGHGELPREERHRLREVARAVFEAESHDIGLAEYWRAVAWEAWIACRGADAMRACEQALVHLGRANALHSRIASSVRLRWRATSPYAPLPVDEALRGIRALAAQDRRPLALAQTRLIEGRLLGMKGDTERARELVSGARQMYVDAGLLYTAGGMAMTEAELELEVGELERAEAILLDGLELLERIADRGYYPTLAVMLAEVLLHQGRLDDVWEWIDRSRETTSADDVVNFVFIDAVSGVVLAHQVRHEEAVASGRRAAELADTTDYVYARPCAHAYFAEILALGGKREEALEHAAIAMEILEAKGNVMLAARFRERLAAVDLDGV